MCGDCGSTFCPRCVALTGDDDERCAACRLELYFACPDCSERLLASTPICPSCDRLFTRKCPSCGFADIWGAPLDCPQCHNALPAEKRLRPSGRLPRWTGLCRSEPDVRSAANPLTRRLDLAPSVDKSCVPSVMHACSRTNWSVRAVVPRSPSVAPDVRPGFGRTVECSACHQFLCPNCGAAVTKDDVSCDFCGVQFTLACPRCGVEVSTTAETCPSCGLDLSGRCPKCRAPLPDGADACRRVVNRFARMRLDGERRCDHVRRLRRPVHAALPALRGDRQRARHSLPKVRRKARIEKISLAPRLSP